MPNARCGAHRPSSTPDRLISNRKWRLRRRPGNRNAAHGRPGVALSSGPEPCSGTRWRGSAPADRGTVPAAAGRGRARAGGSRGGVVFRLPAVWASCAHLPTIPCLRRRASAGDTLQQSGRNAVPDPAFSLLRFLLVSEPGPAWIMPVAGTFMRTRHAAGPECMGSPLIARPQPGGESGRICAVFRRIARRRMPSALLRGLPFADVRPVRFVDRATSGAIPGLRWADPPRTTCAIARRWAGIAMTRPFLAARAISGGRDTVRGAVAASRSRHRTPPPGAGRVGRPRGARRELPAGGRSGLGLNERTPGPGRTTDPARVPVLQASSSRHSGALSSARRAK